jgi:hypothetical protein
MHSHAPTSSQRVLATFAWPEHNLYVLLSEPGRRTPDQMYREAMLLRDDGRRVLCFEHQELDDSPERLVEAVRACIRDPHLTPAPWGRPPTLYVAVHPPGDPMSRAELEQLLRDTCDEWDRWVIVEPDVVERPEVLTALIAEHVPDRPDAEIAFMTRNPPSA